LCGVALLLVAGCTSSASPAPAIGTLAWHAVTLPADPRGRDMVRAVSQCDGTWYAAGAILTSDGTTVPAAWASRDRVTFTPIRVSPVSYYGARDAFTTLACRGGSLVALGSSAGGAHGNPRPSTWLSTGGGPLTEHPAGFELFGGENQIGLGSMSAGPAGFLLTGARIDRTGGAGAAVWTSPTGRVFTLHDGDPGLESDVDHGITEISAAAVLGGGFLGVGDITPPHSAMAARDPLAWTSPNGVTWQRIPFPRTAADDMLLNAVSDGSGVTAVGTDGSRFTAWTASASATGWRQVGGFGEVAHGTGTQTPAVPSIVSTGTGIAYAVVSTAAEYQLWRGHDGTFTRVALPEAVSATPVRAGPRVVVAASAGPELMLGIDDGTTAHIWFAATS